MPTITLSSTAPCRVRRRSLPLRAAKLGWRDYEDCLIALAAEKVHADYVITRGAKGFLRSSVPPISPAAWLEKMECERGLAYGAVNLSEIS